MKQKCKSCPYFSSNPSNNLNLDILKEILKYTKFLALNKERLETEKEHELISEIHRLNRFLPLYIQSDYASNNSNKSNGDKQ